MSHVRLIDPATATGRVAELFAATKRTMGVTPNVTKAMANSPATLDGFVALFGALKAGVLPAAMQERIALAVAEANGCRYCLSAHTYVASNVAKLPEEEIHAARRGESSDPKNAALLRLAVELTENRGRPDAATFRAARDAGLTDEEVVEVIANVVRNIFTNYINEALDVEIEWPVVEPYDRISTSNGS